jgi:hypothetical protein
MQQIEQVFLREVVRLHHKVLGFAKLTELKAFLKARGVDEDGAKGYIYNHSIAEKLTRISDIVFEVVFGKREAIIQALADSGNPGAATYLRTILDRVAPSGGEAGVARVPLSRTIAAHWLNSQGRGNRVLRTGVYQVFRRYKPAQLANGGGGVPDDVIVVELFYADSETLETVLVTSEANLYWGSLHINHRSTLYGLMQRPHELAATNQPVSVRFYAVNIKHYAGRLRPPYSGLYIKTGDISELPLSGDCIFVQVPLADNQALHERMKGFLAEPFADRNVSDDDVVMDYVAGFDEAGESERAPLRIADFPFIRSLLEEAPDRDPLFRPPTRALSSQAVTERAQGKPLPVFRHSNSGAEPEPLLL